MTVDCRCCGTKQAVMTMTTIMLLCLLQSWSVVLVDARAVVSVTFGGNISERGDALLNFSYCVHTELIALDPLPTIEDPHPPTVMIAIDSDTTAAVYLETASYRYGIVALAQAVHNANSSFGSSNCSSSLVAQSLPHIVGVIVAEEYEPGDNSTSSSSSGSDGASDSASDATMGYVLTAASVVCVVVTHLVLRGKTLEAF